MIETAAIFIGGYLTGYFWHSHVLPFLKRRWTRWRDDDPGTY